MGASDITRKLRRSESSSGDKLKESSKKQSSESGSENLTKSAKLSKPHDSSSIGMAPRLKVRASVSIKYQEIIGCSDRREGKMVFVSWRRVTKKENTGETSRAFCESKKVNLEDCSLLSFECTFSEGTKRGKMAEKPILFAIKEDTGKKGSLIGDGTLNLSEYLPHSQEPVTKDIEVPIRSSSKSENLILKLQLT